jgi:hypothetical protein
VPPIATLRKLLAAADPKQGKAALKGGVRQREFDAVRLRLHLVEFRKGGFAVPLGVDVDPAREKQAVEVT